MRNVMRVLAGMVMLTFVLGVDGAWAAAKVSVTREENKPQTVEIKAGEEVRFINASGSTAHVWFAGNDAIRFYVGKAGSSVKFEKPGTYEYTVHVTGSKVHSHTGTVVVK
jgi:plastocyanin